MEPTTRQALNDLKPGDRVEVVQTVRVGMKTWTATVAGAVVRVERRRHGLHFRRSYDDKVFSDVIVLGLDDGALSTVAVDEFTQLKRL